MSGGHFNYDDQGACNDLEEFLNQTQDQFPGFSIRAINAIRTIGRFLHIVDWVRSGDTSFDEHGGEAKFEADSIITLAESVSLGYSPEERKD